MARSLPVLATLSFAIWAAMLPAYTTAQLKTPLAAPLYANATRLQDDVAALSQYRPGYPFWRHIFTVPDGYIAFGSAVDGRLIVLFPTKGDWTRGARWTEPSLSGLLDGIDLPADLDRRRDEVASLLEHFAGPVVHNPTRGGFLLPNAHRYGGFLSECGKIYERFGVPHDIGLAQAMIESGLNGTRRSSARAVGFCQWLERNWRRLDNATPHVIEAHNQTTQAPYCAAYLAVLAHRYGSFIPALSEHHSGGTNVARVLVNGGRLGGDDVRSRYFLGSQFTRAVRRIDLYGFRDIYRTYGPRSALYAEMVFGNRATVTRVIESTPQRRIYAMRTPRAIPMSEILKRTGLSADEIRRFNPALRTRVPARATLYLPEYVKAFGADVAFWHRPPSKAYASVLADFLDQPAAADPWDDAQAHAVLREFQTRFARTSTEEGSIMATVLGYAIDDARTSGRGAILAEFRASPDIERLFEKAKEALDLARGPQLAAAPQLEEFPER